MQPCSLDPATQKLITNIFSKDMFKNAMTLMNLGEGEGPCRMAEPWDGRAAKLSPPILPFPRCEEDAPRKIEQRADCTGF